MRRRPWFVGAFAFVTVLAVGGVSLAAQGMFGEPPPSEPVPLTDAAPHPASTPELTSDVAPAPSAVSSTLPGAAATDETRSDPAASAIADDATADVPAPDVPVTAVPLVLSPETDATETVTPPPEVDATPPPLTIDSPADGAVSSEAVIEFAGTTEPGARVTAGKYAAEVDDEGHWAIVLVLSPGANGAAFRAEDEHGNVTEASIVVHYEEPKTEDPKTEEPKTEKPKTEDPKTEEPKVNPGFAAHQSVATSDHMPPYEILWGTATPGAKVWIGSEYGSTKVFAGDDGTWEAKVWFSEAAAGRTFAIVVESGEHRAELGFTSTAVVPEPIVFTAQQQYGSCESDPPYDVFWGTAPPGTKVWVESAYGGGHAYAGDHGNWELKVEFDAAPSGEAFGVYVSSEHGSADFSFVSHRPDE